jgi:hypothetical protein
MVSPDQQPAAYPVYCEGGAGEEEEFVDYQNNFPVNQPYLSHQQTPNEEPPYSNSSLGRHPNYSRLGQMN